MRKFKVSSKTKKGVFYIVEANENEIECNCPAGERGFECNHKKLIKDFIDRKLISSEQLLRIKEI